MQDEQRATERRQRDPRDPLCGDDIAEYRSEDVGDGRHQKERAQRQGHDADEAGEGQSPRRTSDHAAGDPIAEQEARNAGRGEENRAQQPEEGSEKIQES